jgi:hypothetical protein
LQFIVKIRKVSSPEAEFLDVIGTKKIFLRWAGPDPTSHFLPTSFLYVNLVAIGPVHLSPVTWPQALRYWYSLTSLMHIVAQLRPVDLHNFLGQIPESSQILGASKLPLLE